MTDPPLVVEYGTLHDLIGPARTGGRLLIEGGRVTGVLPDSAPEPDGAVRLRGRSVVPGLINAHEHLEQDAGPDPAAVIASTTASQRAVVAAQHAGQALRSGVTTIRDLGSSSRIAIEIRDAIAAGTIEGPTVVAAGRVICMTGGHGHFAGRQADGTEEVRRAVRAELADGADCIKLIATGGVITPGAVPALPQLSEEELRAGVEEAHRHGLRCAAHAIGTEGVKNAVRAGIDSIEHGFLIDDEGIELMLDHDTRLVPTLHALRGILDAAPDTVPGWIRSKAQDVAAGAEENLRRAYDAGVRIVAGSDAGTPFNGHDSFARELSLMRKTLGMSADEVVRAATVDAAELLGVDRGTLAPGAIADLVVLDRDIDHPDAFAAPSAVVRAGKLVMAP